MTLVTYGRGEDVTDGFTLVPVMNAFGQLDVKHVVTLQTNQNDRQQRIANIRIHENVSQENDFIRNLSHHEPFMTNSFTINRYIMNNAPVKYRSFCRR